MGRPETRINPADGPLQSFAYELRTLRKSVGNPSYRLLASRANYSGTTLSEAARGISLPSLEVTLAYVSACGGDTISWRRRWKETNAALHAISEDSDGDFLPKSTASPESTMSPPATADDHPTHGGDTFDVRVKRVPVLTSAAGLVHNKHKVLTLAVAAGACVASGFWLGRGRRSV
ncbi:hypothetical protein SSP35_02_03480 [Streptomyces sp. NBRC 110611]|nr:hypothetical protein SSP35_02_03480 [Streptomyces sp. NBRC 110611]